MNSGGEKIIHLADFVPSFPFDDLERDWICKTIKDAIKAVKDGKRDVYRRSDKETGSIA